jgi:hypothetical protein
MGWLLFQGSIVFAVISSNIYFQWTPNMMLAGVAGVFAAYGATQAITALRARDHETQD